MRCSICGETDPDEFYKNEKYRCKECSRKRRRKYYSNNKILERDRSKKNKENNKEYYYNYNKKYRDNNKEYFKQKRKENYNKEIAEIKYKIWKEKNRDKYLDTKRRCSKRYNKTINGKINHYMGTAIWRCLKENKNNKKWEDIVGYTKEELLSRLVETLPDGYSFEDYLNGKLHVDHIIPKSIYDFNNKDDVKKCWNLKNLRLLEANENLKKNDKIDENIILFYGIENLLPENYLAGKEK